MNKHMTGLAIAALLTIGSSLAYADDVPAAKDSVTPVAAPTAATPATPAQGEAPASVPRPAIVPQATEALPPAAPESAPSRHRRYVHRHYRRYATWEPFPIYWPHIGRHSVYWSRVSWFGFRF
jgi:hypothetical protein